MTARPLAVGDVIHGFAYGAFGRDHYDCTRIEATGRDWIVTREPATGCVEFVAGERSLRFCQQARNEECPLDGPCPVEAGPRLTEYGPVW